VTGISVRRDIASHLKRLSVGETMARSMDSPLIRYVASIRKVPDVDNRLRTSAAMTVTIAQPSDLTDLEWEKGR
jgi:hypothetical protein